MPRILAWGLLAALLACAEPREPEPGPGRPAAGAWSLEAPGGAARAEIDPHRSRLRILDASGRVVVEAAAPGLTLRHGRRLLELGASAVGSGSDSVLELAVETDAGSGGLRLEWRDSRTLVVELEPPDRAAVRQFCGHLALRPGEAIYGLSERATDSFVWGNKPPFRELVPDDRGTLDRRGERVEMYVRPTIALYAPFFHSSQGYGAYVDTTLPGEFDVGDSQDDVLRFCFESPGREQDRSFRVTYFLGDPAEIVDAYTALTGRPFVPPDWALRHWRWRDELEAGPVAELDGVEIQAEIAEDLEMYDRLGIPAGVYLIDRPWSEGEYGFETFRWDDRRFPNKEKMFEAFAARGWKLALWSAAVAVGENLEVARRRGFLAPGSDRVLDLTNPLARDWWADLHVPFLRRWGVQALKLDRGDEHVPSRARDRWHDGRSGRDMHNAYPELQAELYADILRRAWGEDRVFKMRAGWAGSQRHGIAWGGDTTAVNWRGKWGSTDLGLRSAIVSLQRAGFLGYAVWGSDTGGYFEFRDREVFARWLELSAFCPFMEIGGHGSHAPWDMPTEPAYDAEMVEIYSRYVRLHHDLVPYLARHARIAGQRGLPVARSLVFDYPDDPAVKDLWDQFLLGDALLVAPVWRSGQRSREVYLPAGEWESFWDRGDVLTGPTHLTVDVPLDHIPVFVRAGASVLTAE